MRTQLETVTVNNFLGKHGLATLAESRTLVNQIGFLIQDHDHFRSLLTRCEPEHRRDMYESLRPHLRFEPKPLDVYLSDAGDLAERKQLPTVDDEGKLVPYRQPNIGAIQEAVKETFLTHSLTLTCSKCTKRLTILAENKALAVQEARRDGWVYYEVDGKSREICPGCPGGNPIVLTRREFELVTQFKMQPHP